jgi:hypothetical protein
MPSKRAASRRDTANGEVVWSRVELFKIVMLDFTGVPTVGQAFADEIFRVFANEHPNLELIPVHANSEVKRMIQRAKTNEMPPIIQPPNS